MSDRECQLRNAAIRPDRIQRQLRVFPKKVGRYERKPIPAQDREPMEFVIVVQGPLSKRPVTSRASLEI